MNTGDILKNFQAGPVLEKLHGFQRDAVDNAFTRLFEAPDSSGRFLIADEAGLGKTMIARGIVAKAVEHLRDRIDRIDVIYICSNHSIARQNINRLNPLPGQKVSSAERITLLPLDIEDLHAQGVNLIAFTPGTSLDVRGNLGTWRERAFLYALLREVWGVPGTGSLNLLQGQVNNWEWFRSQAYQIHAKVTKSLATSSLISKLAENLSATTSLRDRFVALCDRFGYARKHIPSEDREDCRVMVGELRGMLARTCISALEPDLVILDEFQRFRGLLSPSDEDPGLKEAAELAQQLFNWNDGNARARVLLLSATPYKPYTLPHEEEQENHYEDFCRTVDFLQGANRGGVSVRSLFAEYRKELLNLKPGDIQQLTELKVAIEFELRKVMSRTERLAVAGESNGMLRSVVSDNLEITPGDIKGYLSLRRLGDSVHAPEVVEYWKSAAYALDFMSGYKIKEELRQALQPEGKKAPEAAVVTALVSTGDTGPNLDALRSLKPLTIANGKMRSLIRDLETMRAFEILWVPPCMPGYGLEGSFAAARAADMTKRLIFSAWNVAPRSIAALLSYEAERRAWTGDPSNAREGSASRDQTALLRFSFDDGRPSGMPALALMYPSPALSGLCDPMQYGGGAPAALPALNEVLQWAQSRIQAAWPPEIHLAEQGELADESWYWIAPLLFDLHADPDQCRQWWQASNLAADWSSADVEPESVEPTETESPTKEDQASNSAWGSHVDLARDVVLGGHWPKGPAPADLPELLALMGLSAPGNCAYRAFAQIAAGPSAAASRRLLAARVGWLFRRLFNRPQSIWLINGMQDQQPYWRQVLRYSAAGGLDATLREYAHVLRDAVGVGSKAPDEALTEIYHAMSEAIGIRSAVLRAEQFGVGPSGQPEVRDYSFPTLFAMRFGSDKSEDSKQVVRDSAVRAAFNSPFWPFVLASTSVGQEGLDFHWYCHAIVHWNLPSNPVDLEQREGRIHRFKGHAVRKNVATRWANQKSDAEAPDQWDAVFKAAEAEARPTDKGLVPYWLFPLKDGSWIERHVPMYPLSRDEFRYRDLKKALGAYRLVFGQPRQDELLAYLLDRIDAESLIQMNQVLRIDLAPPTRSRS